MKENKKTIKTYFETGDKPTQEQFENLIDSYLDSKQSEGEPNRSFVIAADGEVSVAPKQAPSEYTISEITGNKLALLKDGKIVTEIDLTPYIDDTNLARLVSGSVDVNGIATFTRDDNSNFTLDLSNLNNGWGLSGNTETDAATNYIGTNDGADFVLKANNTEMIRLSTLNSRVGILNNNPKSKLDISGTGGEGNNGVLIVRANQEDKTVQLSQSWDGSRNNGEISLYEMPYGGTTSLKKVHITARGDSYFNNGNIGIGVQFPTAKLDVQGIIKSNVTVSQIASGTNKTLITKEYADTNYNNTPQAIPEYTFSEIKNNKITLLKDGKIVKEIDLTTYLNNNPNFENYLLTQENTVKIGHLEDEENSSLELNNESGTILKSNDRLELVARNIAFRRNESSNSLSFDIDSVNGDKVVEFQNKNGVLATLDDIPSQTIPDWNQNDNGQNDFIKNKPIVPFYLAGSNINIDKTNPLKPIINSNPPSIDEVLTAGNIASSDFVTNSNIIIDPASSTKNIANSLLTIKNESTATGINATQFVDVKRTGTIANTSNTIAGVFRSTNSSTVNIDGISAVNLVGRYDGTGGGNYVYGAITNASYEGSGNLNFLIPSSETAEVKGTGTGIIDYVRGHSPQAKLNNPNATVNWMQGAHPNVTINAGTVTKDVNVIFLDIDINTPNSANIDIQGNMTYLRGGGGSDVISAVIGGKKRFIWNEGNFESDFNGVINVLNDVKDIEKASNKVLITKEYADAKYNANSSILKTRIFETTDLTENNSAPNFLLTHNLNVNYYTRMQVIIPFNNSGGNEVSQSLFDLVVNNNAGILEIINSNQIDIRGVDFTIAPYKDYKILLEYVEN